MSSHARSKAKSRPRSQLRTHSLESTHTERPSKENSRRQSLTAAALAQFAADLVRQHLELLGLPDPESLEEPETESTEDEPDLADVVEELESRLHGDRVTFDRGTRMYHAMTTVKKAIRCRCTLAGEPIVEVDMHASFVAVIAYLYARGESRSRS